MLTPKQLFTDLVVQLLPITYGDKTFISIEEMISYLQENNIHEDINIHEAVIEIVRLVNLVDDTGHSLDPTVYNQDTLGQIESLSEEDLFSLAEEVILYCASLRDAGYRLQDKDGIVLAKFFSMLPQKYAANVFWPDIFSMFNNIMDDYSYILHRWLAPQCLRIFKVEMGLRSIGVQPTLPSWM